MAALYGHGVLPLAADMGTHVEESAGLSPTRPLYLDPATTTLPSPDERVHGAVTSRQLPVWGWQGTDGRWLPLMIDGHLSALPWVPSRLAGAAFGLAGARGLAVLIGLLTIGLLMLLAGRISGVVAAAFTGLLAASSPHFAFAFHWSRPDEQLSAALPLAGLYALLRARDDATWPWMAAAGLSFGVALAAKLTAAWLIVPVVLGLWLVGERPRPGTRGWIALIIAGAVPLIPTIAYLGMAETSAFAQRLASVATPDQWLQPERLLYFARHFGVAFGTIGAYLADLVAGTHTATEGAPVAAFGIVGGLAVTAAAALSGRGPRLVRALGIAVLGALLVYVTLYYKGMSLFMLLAAAVPLGAGVGLGVAATRWGRLPRALALLALLLSVGAGVAQVRLVHDAVARPAYPVFSRSLQKRVARELVAVGTTSPWTFTYAFAGVIELDSAGAVRPVHAFPVFWQTACDRGEDGMQKAWRDVLARMPAGRHVLLLADNPSRIAISPCRDGPLFSRILATEVEKLGVTLRAVPWPADMPDAGLLTRYEVTVP